MIGTLRFISVYMLLCITVLFTMFHKNFSVHMNRPFSQFPIDVNGWRMTSQSEFSDDILDVLRPTDYLSRQYTSEKGNIVNLYVGYHSGDKEKSSIHSPKHCLPGSGWYMVGSEKIYIDTNRGRLRLVKAVYQKGDQKELFLYWFIAQGRTFSDEYALEFYEIINSMINRRRDAAFVRISIPFENNDKNAASHGIKFIRDFYPLIKDFLPM